MKISINWAFDHIVCDKPIDIKQLIHRFNKTTAEIESVIPIKYTTDQWFLMQITALDADRISLHNPALNKSATLSHRTDVAIGDWVLIKYEGQNASWLTLHDLGGSKDGLVAPIFVHDTDPKWLSEGWKKELEDDHVIEIDNKSITHRPDMWGHRGIAREFAAILELQLKPLNGMLHEVTTQHHEWEGTLDHRAIVIDNKEACKRFAGLTVTNVNNRASSLAMTQRLARVDSRGINFLVDCTNYVMYDLGQPMHAFDAQTLKGNQLHVRSAREKETLMLLDKTTVTLSAQDLIIADAERPIALAGVMGGNTTAVQTTTTALLVESACFDATTVRKTALRHKKRTDASARFEKSLDPFQNVTALKRYLALLDQHKVTYHASSMLSLGVKETAQVIVVDHQFIEQRLGLTIAPAFVVKTLEALSCVVNLIKTDDTITYKITVPSFRATKDLVRKEDIVEEVGRFFGYDQIPQQLPDIESSPKDMHAVNQLKQIKHYCAYAGRMREVYHYAIYDESWLAELQWEPGQSIRIENPLSEHWQRLVTSLIPHMLKAVSINKTEHDQLRFFEWARVWSLQGQQIQERKSLSGIIYQAHQPVDFYAGKALIDQLFASLGCTTTWHQMEKSDLPWYTPYQSATITIADQMVGYAGMLNQYFIKELLTGTAFIFELDGDFLSSYVKPTQLLKPISKYPEMRRDISLMVPLTMTVEQITGLINAADERIVQVLLIDRFEKEEWRDMKGLTFRFVVRDMHKTMTTQEVDAIWDAIAATLKQLGAQIR